MGHSDPVVHLYHNVVSPYRLPLFEALAEDYDITVYFSKYNEDGRKWDTDVDLEFDHDFLPSIDIGPFCLTYDVFLRMFHNDPDVHIHTETHHTLFAILSSIIYTRIFGGSFILWTEWVNTEASKSNFSHSGISLLKSVAGDLLYKILRPIMYREADVLIAYSQKSEEFLLDHGVTKEKIITGEQVMPETCLQPPDSQSKHNSENPVFLFLGYLNRRKGIDVLIDAWTSFENEGAELLIAGSGPERTRLKDRTDDSITWLGYVDPKQKATLYDTADVFVFPTRHDPWGLVVNEAISYGTPVITTTAAGAAQLVRQHGCGCTIPPDDTPALVSAFERLKEGEQRRKMIPDVQTRRSVTDIEKGTQPIRKALDII